MHHDYFDIGGRSDDVVCEHAIENNSDTSHCSECMHVCGSHLQKILVHVRFGGGGEGVQKK